MADRMLTVKEAAERMGISRAYLYELLAAGEAPANAKVGRRRLFPESAVDAWIKHAVA